MIVYGLYHGTTSSPYGYTNINRLMDFSGASIQTDSILLTPNNFGLFPYEGLHRVLQDANFLVSHEDKAKIDAFSLAGSASFAGVVLVDYSGFWHAHFDWSDYDTDQGFFYEEGFDETLACDDSNLYDITDRDYKEDFYNYFYCNNPTQIMDLYTAQQSGEGESLDTFMRQQWNATARAFFETTISSIRAALPLAKIGFLNYPTTIYKNERLTSSAPNVFGYGSGGLGSTINDDLSWLYEELDILCPYLEAVRHSVEDNKTPQTGIENTRSQNQIYLQSNLDETLRISQDVRTLSAPVLPHFYNINNQIPYHGTLLNNINEVQQVYLSEQAGVNYIINFSYVGSEQQKLDIESRFVVEEGGLSVQGFGFNSLGRTTEVAAGLEATIADFIDPDFDQPDTGDPEPDPLGTNNDPPVMGVDRRNVRVYPLWEDAFLTLSGRTGQFSDWWEVPEGVDNLIARLDNDFEDGFRRFMLYLPAGGLANAPIQSPNQWFTMSEARREEIETKLGAWIDANPNADIMLFSGLKIELDTDKLGTHELDFDNAVVPDLINDSVAADYIRQNLEPWVNIGVTNFVYPMAFEDDTQEDFLSFALTNWVFNRRVTGIGLPVVDGQISEGEISSFPIAIRIQDLLDLQEDNVWDFSTANTEIGVIISPFYDFSASDLMALEDRGFVYYTTEGWPNEVLGINDTELQVDASTGIVPTFVTDNEAGTDPIEGFGLVRYAPGTATAVGESDGEAYAEREVIAIANSLDGTFELNTELNKYTVVTADILNPSFVNTSYPHYVIEDSFEWVNSGMPSHLSQVFHANMATMGVNLTRTNEADMARVPPYQARYIVPCNQSFYDAFNSTIDFELESDNGAREVFIPYTNATVYVSELNSVWVGGVGGVISIDVDTKQINEVIIDSRRSLRIQDIFVLNDEVFVADQTAVYVYSLLDGSITRDPALGVETNIRRFVKTRNDTFVIGAEDGIYARKSTQDEYQFVQETGSPVDRIIHPDATIAIAGREVYYTTDGFTWTLVGTASQEISDIAKYRNKIVFATDEGIYDDNGNVYAGRLSLRLNDVFNDLQMSRDIIVNATDATVLKVLSGLNDGRYIVQDDLGFAVGSIDGIDSIHSTLIVDGENWIFGYDKFAITSEGVVRLLATGTTLTDDLNGVGQIV